MKKLTFTIPILFLFIHLMYGGLGIWTQDLTGSGAIWQQGIAINPTNQLIMYAASNTQGMYKTTNGGSNWTQINTGITNLTLNAVSISRSNPNILYCGGGALGVPNGMYRTTDAGATWTAINSGITEAVNTVQAIDVSPTDPNTAYIGVWDGSTTANAVTGLFKTTNGGTTWTGASTGMGACKNILSIAVNPLNSNVVYAGTSFLQNPQTGPSFIYKSGDAATNWTNMSNGLPTATTELNPVRSLSISRIDTAVVLAGLFQNTTTGGAYWTNNGGASWTRRSQGIPNVVGVQIRAVLIRPGSSSVFYAGLDNATTGGVYRSLDAGLTWTDFNGGSLPASSTVRALNFRTSPDSTIYAGLAVGPQGVHEYTIVPVGIYNQNGNIPTSFALYQNFPNPFNPATYIQYDVPKESFVTLKVYDIGGREISSPVNETKQAGSYQILFDASRLTSGVYFYTIKAGDFTETKKMMLIK